jgi:predicted DsbA family dithiol-disulfide isomerase
VHVEIWSDIACPWCYVGKRRFEAALAAFEHRDEVTVTWRSFELDPEAPPAREGDNATRLAEKYGMEREQAIASQQSLARHAAGDGIEMRFDLTKGANTFDAHRLAHLAAAHGEQEAMTERLFRAHHTEGELVSDHEVLARLAAEIGLPADEVRPTLGSDRYGAQVREDEVLAARIGIQGVPFFVIDRAIGVSGAQEPDVLGELLRRGWEKRSAAAA